MARREEYQPVALKYALSANLVDELRKMVKILQKHFKNAPKRLQAHLSEPASHRKPDVIDWIQRVVTTPDMAGFLYSQMNELEQAALSEAVHDPGGALDPVQVAAKYGGYPILGGSGRSSMLRGVAGKGMASCPLLGILLAGQFVVPRDVQTVYRAFVPEPKQKAPEHIQDLPEWMRLPNGESTRDYRVHATEQSALLDVQAMLNLVAQGKVGVGAKTGRVSKVGARNVRKILSQGDFYAEDEEAPHQYDVQMGQAGIRPFAWPLLLQAGKLAQIEGNKLALTRSGQAALKKKPHEVLKTLWERWLKTTIIHEMNRVEVIKGQKSKKRPLYAARTGRETLEEVLTDLTPGRWILIQDFLKHLFARGDGLDIVRNDFALYLLDPVYGSFGYSHIEWDMLTGRFIRAFLLEYAATLGLIDVGLVPPWGAVSDLRELWGADELSCLSRYDGLLALRLTHLGAWILGQSTDYAPPKPAASLDITPDLQIGLRDPRGNAAAKSLLERFCSQKDEATFRLEASQTLQAVEQGMSVQEMQDFLQENSGNELPGQVKAFLAQMEQRASLFRVAGEAFLVECSDPNVLQSILEDPTMRRLCLPAGKSSLVVRKGDEEAFRNCLHNHGYGLPLA